MFGKTPLITVIVNGVLVKAMADSGAKVSLVTVECYINYLLPGKVVLHDVNWQITDASGAAILVDLEVEGKSYSKVWFVKRSMKGAGVVHGTQLSLLLRIDVLAELMKE